MRRTRAAPVAAVLLTVALCGEASASPASDGFIAGYATAVLERQLRIEGATVRVEDGVVTLALPAPPRDRDRLVAAIQQIRGVVQVKIEVAWPTPSPSPTPSGEPAAAASGIAVGVAHLPEFELLPSRSLFAPLQADPRWPHSSASYQNVNGSRELRSAWSLSLGDTFELAEGAAPGGRWQLGIQGAVFSVFDRGTPSKDLIDTDYRVGLPIAYRSGPFSAQLRYFHESTHLGDELLLRDGSVRRINLSYEQVDLLGSYDFAGQFRAYGGGGYIVRSECDLADVICRPRLQPWSIELGGEWASPVSFVGGYLRPVAATDLKLLEYETWTPNFSARAGIEVEGGPATTRRIQLLLEYYNGRSPWGQFFPETIEYFGFGAHLYF
jgi:hypothetical protein